MRIGLVDAEFPGRVSQGGLSTYYCNLAGALVSAGHSVFLARLAGSAGPTPPRNVELALIEGGRGPRGPWARLQERFSLPEIRHQRALSRSAFHLFLERHALRPFDAVQVPEFNGLASEFKGAPFPVTVRFHTPSYLVDRLNGNGVTAARRAWYRLEGEGLSRASGFTASSKALREEVCAFYRMDPARVRVLRNPVDVTGFHPPPSALPARPVTILFAGRFEARKGAALLPAVVKALLALHPGLRFIFAGPGGGPSGHPSAAALSGLGERVGLPGELPRAQLPDLYRSADIFFIPSLFDNSPNTLFEAMASGLACAGSDVGGINEIITSGEDGLLFNPRELNDMVSALHRLAADPVLRRRLGGAARRKMETEYSPEKTAERMTEFYATLGKSRESFR